MPIQHRRAFRHAVRLPCQIVRERDFRLVAELAVDLSTDGMLVRTELPVLTGEGLLVSFRPPHATAWLDAQAVVARVVHGRRPGDRGRCLRLTFQGLDEDLRELLFRGLRRVPPASVGGKGPHTRRGELTF